MFEWQIENNFSDGSEVYIFFVMDENASSI